jgi:tetratricopeptide (TPR) repeat protein/O-antigen ligase
MQTRLSLFCDRIVEAGWLAAAVVAPVYFNLASDRIFDPDKTALVRHLALIMGLAWLIGFLETGKGAPPLRTRLTGWLRTPLVIPALALVAVCLLATASSIALRSSLWGSYTRAQGLYSTLSYVLIFGLAARRLRTRAQVNRLMTAVILGSAPVALYGIVQHFYLDPFWPHDLPVTMTSVSTMGNTVLVSAYLVMVTPLALSRLLARLADSPIQSGWAIRLFSPAVAGLALSRLFLRGVSLLAAASSEAAFHLTTADGLALAAVALGLLLAVLAWRGPAARLAEAIGLTFVLLSHLTCLYYTQARGPLLGLLAGLAFFLVLLALYRNQRPVIGITVAAGLAVVTFLVVFNLPDSPLAPLRDQPVIGRFGRFLDDTSGNASTGVIRLILWQSTVEMARADPWRSLVGYGPETLTLAFPPFSSTELAQYLGYRALPTRAHNGVLDALAAQGVAGLAAYLALWGALLYRGLDGLGLVSERRKKPLAVAYGLAVALVCLLALFAPYLWVALAGLVLAAAAGLYALGLGSLTRRPAAAQGEPGRDLLLVGLLAALLAHLVETQFGFALTATSTTFWLLAGLLAAIGFHKPATQRGPQSAPGAPDCGPVRATGHDSAPDGWLSALLVISLVASLFDPIWPVTGVRAGVVAALLVASWLAMALIQLPPLLEQSQAPVKTALGYSLLTWGSAGLFALARDWLLKLFLAPDVPLLVFHVGLLVMLVGGALALRGQAGQQGIPLCSRRAPAYLLLVLAAAAATLALNVTPIRADAWAGRAAILAKRGDDAQAVVGYARALKLAPDQDVYAALLGGSYLHLLQAGAGDPVQRAQWLRAGEEALLRAHALSPLTADYDNALAYWYRLVGQDYEQALAYSRQAVALNPRNVLYWNQMALSYLAQGEIQQAEQTFRHSLELDPLYDETYDLLADAYRSLGRNDEALAVYLEAVAALETGQPYFRERHARMCARLGDLYQELGQPAEAQFWYQRAEEIDPQSR